MTFMWLRGPRPDPRVEQAAGRPLTLRPVHRQRRGHAPAAEPLARPQAPKDRQHQARQADDLRGDPAELLLTQAEATKPNRITLPPPLQGRERTQSQGPLA